MASAASQPASLASFISAPTGGIFLDDAQMEALTDAGNLVVNHYEFLRELGRGAYAVVALARHEAVKCFSKSHLARKRDVSRNSISGAMNVVTALDKVENEYSILSKLGCHANTVELLGVIDAPDSDDLYYIMEYVDGGVVMDYDKDAHVFKSSWTAGVLPEPAVRRIALGVASALAVAHSKHVVHRDVKPDNVLVSSSGRIKLADWGVAHDFESGALTGSMQDALAALAQASLQDGADLAEAEAAAAQSAADKMKAPSAAAPPSSTLRGTEGTFQFLSPEECSAPDFNGYKADIWSMGVTLWVLATGGLPFGAAACNPMDLFEAIERQPLPPKPAGMSQDMYDFLALVLVKDPTARPSAVEVLAHPWIIAAESEANALARWPALITDALPRFKSPKMAFLQLAKAKLASGSVGSAAAGQGGGLGGHGHTRDPSVISEATLDEMAAVAPGGGAPGGMSEPLATPLENGVWAKTLTKVLLRGWLFKRGRMRKTWKRRYFVLSVPQEDELFAQGVTEPSLTYFKENPEEDDRQQPKGCMALSNCDGANVKPKPQKPLRFRVAAGGRQLFLQAGTESAMQSWVQAINKVAEDHH